jgi:hypothetical protein
VTRSSSTRLILSGRRPAHKLDGLTTATSNISRACIAGCRNTQFAHRENFGAVADKSLVISHRTNIYMLVGKLRIGPAEESPI